MPKQTEKDFPAGHERDEFNRKERDLAAEAGEEAAKLVDPIDPNKLDSSKVDNEIARWVSRAHGEIPVSNAEKYPEFRFCWMTDANEYERSQGNVRANLRQMEASLRIKGYFPWIDDFDKSTDRKERVGWEHRGEGHAVGSSLRCIGDVVLFAIRTEKYEQNMEEDRRKRLRDLGIETDLDRIPRQFKNTVFGINDERMARTYGKDAMQPLTYSAAFAQSKNGG